MDTSINGPIIPGRRFPHCSAQPQCPKSRDLMFPGSVNQLRDIHVNLKPLLWGSALAHSCDACCGRQEASLERASTLYQIPGIVPLLGRAKASATGTRFGTRALLHTPSRFGMGQSVTQRVCQEGPETAYSSLASPSAAAAGLLRVTCEQLGPTGRFLPADTSASSAVPAQPRRHRSRRLPDLTTYLFLQPHFSHSHPSPDSRPCSSPPAPFLCLIA